MTSAAQKDHFWRYLQAYFRPKLGAFLVVFDALEWLKEEYIYNFIAYYFNRKIDARSNSFLPNLAYSMSIKSSFVL